MFHTKGVSGVRNSPGATSSFSSPRMLVFGCSLPELLSRDRQARPYLKVPLFFSKIIKRLIAYGITQPGIFKLAGSGPEVQRLQQQIDAGEKISLKQVEDVHSISSLLKNFLRSLPDCLLSSVLYERWLRLSDTTDVVERIQKTNELVQRLPPANQAALLELMRLLYLIDLNAEISKMDASALSSLMSKNLLWRDGGRDAELPLDEAVKLNDVVKLMIQEYPVLFESEERKYCSAKPDITKFSLFKRKLAGHKKSINCIASSWDGRCVWSADTGGCIRVWSVEDMRLVKEIDTEQGRIFSLKRVGDRMWSASERSIQVRDEKGLLLKEMSGSTLSVVAVNERTVWTAGETHLRIWDTHTLGCRREIPTSGLVLSMTVTHDQNTAFVWGACADKKIRVWNAASGELVKELVGHSRKVNDILAIPGTPYVWSASDDKSVSVWNAKTLEREKREKNHEGYIFGLTWLGRHVWSSSWDKTVVVWDGPAACTPLCKISGYHADAVTSAVAVYSMRRGTWMCWTASFDRTLVIWEMAEGACTLPRPSVSGGGAPGSASSASDVLSDTRRFHGGLVESSPSHADLFERSLAGDLSATGAMGGGSGIRDTMTMTAARDLAAGGSSSSAPGPSDPTGLGRWEIDPEAIKSPGNSLGTGSFGTVFKAELHGKPVAVKRLTTQKFDEKTLEDFRKEVAIMSTLRHPNVLLFMGACTRPGNLLIVTELMPRGSVYDLLRDPKANLTFKRKMLFAKDAALGVNWLHRSKPQFLHLDLKAANLLVDENWTVKVADFGLSVVKKDAAEKKEKHGPIGTPLWMAPEVLMNSEYDEKADIYSFAIVLWELLMAQDPWQEIESLVELVDAVCLEHKRPPLPREIPESLRALINACWHPETEKRPSFEEIIPRFDDIIIDGIIDDTLGRAFWRQHFLGKLSVSWPEFVRAFAGFCKIPLPSDPRDIQFQCFRSVVTHGKEQDKVTGESFAKMLAWFGPLREEGILGRIYELLKNPYFHGEISSQEAEKKVAGQKKGTFLLRFSSRDPGCYALTVLNAKGVLKHYRIMHRPGGPYAIGKVECSSLNSLIKRYHKELHLKHACPGSKYEPMMVAYEKDITSLGYREVDV